MKTSLIDRDPLYPGTCEVCGKTCELEDAVCGITCEAELGRRERLQGRAVIRTLKRWRRHRGRKGTPGEGALTEVTLMMDTFLRQDRVARKESTAEREALRDDSEER